MIRSCLVLLAVGCGSAPSHDGPADAAAPPADAAPTADAAAPSPDAMASSDAPAADASPDAVVVVPDLCPHRTVGPGLPQHPYAPSETFTGDLRIGSTADLVVLEGIKLITGDLTISGVVGPVTIADLEVVGGTLEAVSDGMTELHLPRLETAGNALRVNLYPSIAKVAVVDAPLLESLRLLQLRLDRGDLSCVQSVEFGVEIVGAQGPVFALPRLVTTNNIQIVACDATAFEVPALQHGSLEIESGALTTVHAGNPDQIGMQDCTPTLTLTSTSNLTSFGASGGRLSDLDFLADATSLTRLALYDDPSLHSIAGVAMSPLEFVTISNAPALADFSALAQAPLGGGLQITQTGATRLAFPRVTKIDATLQITGNPALASVAMPNLAWLYGSGNAIANNPLLPTCQPAEISDHTTVNDNSPFDISGNLPDACSSLRKTPAGRARLRGRATSRR